MQDDLSQSAETGSFRIGLAMAGAISAGCYSAGVLDFLIQALDAQETASRDEANHEKANPQTAAEVPPRRAVIQVISGASAGAVTGALGAIAMAGPTVPTAWEPAEQARLKHGETPFKYVLPQTYATWVVSPNMVAPDGQGRDLLDLSDLKADKKLTSLLNAQLLDAIRDAALTLPLPAVPKPYIAAPLDIYMTLSNLRGVPYDIPFKGGVHGMMSHADHVHYRLTGIGTAANASPFSEENGQCLAIADVEATGTPRAEWESYAMAALGSAAFPFGLSPRRITICMREYQTLRWPSRDDRVRRPVPAFVARFTPGTPPDNYAFRCVDGGVMDNEPFEFARQSLLAPGEQQNKTGKDDADRAVIMIDPFPEPPAFSRDLAPDADLLSIARALFPALVNQARFKPDELLLAADETIYSRFFISPHRTREGRPEGRLALASGLLGGFGGFLSRRFRDHDFQLGRRNCQKFLRDSFALGAGNKLVAGWTPAQAARFDTPRLNGDRPIIPLVGTAHADVPLLDWPRLAAAELATLNARIEPRARAVIQKLIREQAPPWHLYLCLQIGVCLTFKSLLSYLRMSVLSDLVLRDQMEGWEMREFRPPQMKDQDAVPLEDPDEGPHRAVLAALLQPAFSTFAEPRSAADIQAATKIDRATVDQVIAHCRSPEAKGKPYEIWQATWETRPGEPLYTLLSRRPPWCRRLWRHTKCAWSAWHHPAPTTAPQT